MSLDPSIFEPDINEENGWEEESETTQRKGKVKVKGPSEESATAFLYASDKPRLEGATLVAQIDISCPSGEWKICILENIDVILEELIENGIDLGRIDDYKFWVVADEDKNILAVMSNPLNPTMISKLRRYLYPIVSAKCKSAIKRVEELEDELAELEAQIDELEGKLRTCKKNLKKCTSSLGKSGDLLAQFIQMAGDLAKSGIELKKHEYEAMKYRYLTQMQPQMTTVQQARTLSPKELREFLETLKEAKDLVRDIIPLVKGESKEEKKEGEKKGGSEDGWA